MFSDHNEIRLEILENDIWQMRKYLGIKYTLLNNSTKEKIKINWNIKLTENEKEHVKVCGM